MPRPAPDARSFLPLTPHAFQVLLALADEARHGYAIIQEVDERTDGIIKLRTGTLYTLLQRLTDETLIQPSAAPESADLRRRYYRITDLGRAVLAAETRRLEALIGEARRKRVIGRTSKA